MAGSPHKKAAIAAGYRYYTIRRGGAQGGENMNKRQKNG